MKSNLDSMYKTSKNSEKEGVWYEVSEDIAFKVKRFGGHNATEIKSVMAKLYKPYANRIEKGTLSAEKEQEILTRAFVEASLVDWRGIIVDGEPKEFSKELAVEVLINLPDLVAEMTQFTTSADNFREDLGN